VAAELERIAAGRTDLVFESAASSEDATRLKWCAYHGDVSAIRFLVARGVPLASLGDNLDLNGAAFHGHWQLVQYLVEQGAEVDRPLPDTGETPLHAALSFANRPQYDKVVEVLLAAGARTDVATHPGVATGSFMRDARTKGETPLHRAAAFASERTIERLLEAGAEKDARDAHGDSPLSWASWHLRPPSVLRLLCFGEHHIHPDNDSTYDHGRGWEQSRGRPLTTKR
jgi:ankyrin repeat protein